MSRELMRIERALAVGSLSTYVHWVNQIPLLTQEEEAEAADKLKNFNDLASARKLVLSHLRLVVKIARGYSGYGLQEADLIQEGNIGLMKAVKRFDPAVGVRLVSFAIHWIRAEIHEFILRNWRIVKIATTKAQRKLFFNLRRKAKERGWFSKAEIETIAGELSVSQADVRHMEMRLNSHDQSFDYKENTDDDAWTAPVNFLEDHSTNPANILENKDWSGTHHDRLHLALESLDDRSREILQRRWLDDPKATLHDLAAEYKVSAERIRQIEQNAMKKMRLAISE